MLLRLLDKSCYRNERYCKKTVSASYRSHPTRPQPRDLARQTQAMPITPGTTFFFLHRAKSGSSRRHVAMHGDRESVGCCVTPSLGQGGWWGGDGPSRQDCVGSRAWPCRQLGAGKRMSTRGRIKASMKSQLLLKLIGFFQGNEAKLKNEQFPASHPPVPHF